MKITSTRGTNQEIPEHSQFLIVLDAQVEMPSGKLTMSLHMTTKLPAPYHSRWQALMQTQPTLQCEQEPGLKAELSGKISQRKNGKIIVFSHDAT